jgi:D-ribose pyranase
MARQGILNPHIASLLCRVRHTNALVIADRGFPNWPELETVDISLVDGIPTVLQVIEAVRWNLEIARVYMAEEFQVENTPEVQARFLKATAGFPLTFEPHEQMKLRVPHAIGLIRTGDETQYANMVLVSGRLEGKP